MSPFFLLIVESFPISSGYFTQPATANLLFPAFCKHFLACLNGRWPDGMILEYLKSGANACKIAAMKLTMPSPVVSKFNYDAAAERYGFFIAGSIYDSFKVPVAVYDKCKVADSKGACLNNCIKGHYRYVKIA